MITGDRKIAEECLVDARKISQQQSNLSVNWMSQWARSATIKQAIQKAHGQILIASHNYDQIHCPHGGHPVIAIEQMRELQSVSAQEIVSELDPFARAVGILRGVSHCVIKDCSIRLGTTSNSVAAACCAFEKWMLRKQRCARDETVHHSELLIW